MCVNLKVVVLEKAKLTEITDKRRVFCGFVGTTDIFTRINELTDDYYGNDKR